MRNLIEYPLTDQEIVACLKEMAIEIADDDAGNLCTGSTRSLILMTAADIIAGRKLGKPET